MDNLRIIVGSKGCPIRDVWSTINICKCTVLHGKWSDFARCLGIDEIRIKEFRQKLLLEKINYSDLIFELLELWVTSNGESATLTVLLHVLEVECKSVQVGESLRARFKSPGRKYIALGHSIPIRPTYYIGRTLITRNIISYDIFEHNSKDIFLIKGMDRLDMTNRVKNKLTGVSNEQINCTKIEPRFIVLKADHHFDLICAKTDNPVHLLRKEVDGKLRWIRSTGDITYLQGCIGHSQSQDELDEEAFCQTLATQTDPVCISDSPGMGKSLLLAEIGSRLTRMFPSRSVSFITLAKFINKVKQLGTDDKINSISNALKNLFGWTVSKTEPDSDEEHPIFFELLLDGFDELDSQDHQMAYDLIREIKHSFKSIRLWVTSRPHLLGELERHLNQLGFNIRPFQMDDQIHFLSSYWTRKKQLDQTKCQRFAKHCLEALKSKMNSTDRDIAGIPLQCLLIGESYEKDAFEYARSDNEMSEVDLQIGTISNLYRSLIKKKILSYQSTDGNYKLDELELMTIHARLGWALIFPEKKEDPDHATDIVGNNEMEQVLKVGILESTSTSQSARFLHRTFAEYFVAWLVLDQLRKNIDEGGVLPGSFLRVLDTQHQIEMRLDSFKFSYPVITYFMDSIISQTTFPTYSTTEVPAEECIYQIAHSCVNANHTNIFNLLLSLNVFEKLASEIFTDKFITLTIWNSSLELVKPVMGIFEQHHQFNSTLQVVAIRTAIKRGKYSILEYLLIQKNLLGILKETNDEEAGFMHDCVENSKNNNEAEIDEKVLIARMLVGINPSLLGTRGGAWKEIPLLSFGVPIRLLMELISLGADVFAQDSNGNTVLHMNYHRSHLSPSDYHDLVLTIGMETLKKLVVLKGKDKNTPLVTILRWISPTSETLLSFNAAGASFNSCDLNGDSVLEIAIKNGRETNSLLELGARINRKPLRWLTNKLGLEKKLESTVLHLAAQHGNLEAVELLLEDRRMDVNVLDEEDRTPLDYAVIYCNAKGKYFEVAVALQSRGGLFKERIGWDGKGIHVLHFAVQNRNLELLRLLIKLGVDVNIKDINGNTALHLVSAFQRPDHTSLTSGTNNFNGAIKFNDFLFATTLIEAGADPSLVNNRSSTPFEIAFALRAFETLEEKVFFNSISKGSLNPALKFVFLLTRSMNNNEQFALLSHKFVGSVGSINYQDPEGNSILHITARSGFAHAANVLANSGANINSRNRKNQTPLHFAADIEDKDASLEVIKILIENGADVFAKDEQKRNFLHVYMSGTPEQQLHQSRIYKLGKSMPTASQFHELVAYLIRNKFYNILKETGFPHKTTLLHFCVQNLVPEERTLSLLHANQVDFNALDSTGDSILFHAISGRQSIRFLDSLIINFGANPEHLNDQRWSVLHQAERHGTVDALQYFLNLNLLNVNGKTTEGNTPLHNSFMTVDQSSIAEKCRLLIDNGANIDITNNNRVTPLALAYKNYDEKKIEKLFTLP